jgi:ubiquinone/menaquinone biosynthesis C-methylase UbiE
MNNIFSILLIKGEKMKESRFDKAAKTWDTAPRLKLAEAVSTAINKNITLNENLNVADYGAGTGLISLTIAPLVKKITAIDTSNEMLEVLKEKAAASGLKNIATVSGDADNKEIQKLRFDVIVSSMTLHHIKSSEEAASLFFSILNEKGTIALADLDEEKGDFHPDNSDVHHFGFNRDVLKKIFADAGFKNIRFDTAYIMKKPAASGEIKDFPIFLLIADK